ncbi:multiheme C-type cytochrome [Flexistipes sinusarabici DSM 4947]|uniref:Multiheme C-type cytochrome n=1 Tax=Flexistipes sinusarabici (strain ATCC 49648 / DSM 4947 / MAS 10) TaxID=717231 RepID=F8E503_FLESM|nr:hypothetical protein [Flexistipes sinusarabici]AEI15639.1 multiheme C-type cytochrome [Flexistipes sinusarabici DSM 4947]
MKRVLCVFIFLFLLIATNSVFAADDENCILCHKYRGLARVDDTGETRLFYVNEDLYQSSVHARIKCTECHSEIEKIPHKTGTKVDCMNECHLTEPTSEKRFSHKGVEKALKNSIHNPDNKYVNNNDDPEDFPKCIDCHTNPLFKPLNIYKNVTSEGLNPKALARCALCHEDENFVKYFYNHVSHRLHRSRNSQEILNMCQNCHKKEELAEKHELKNAVETYLDTFHGKAVKFDYHGAPDCIDCHVKMNKSAHSIKSYENPESAVHESNRWKTCARPSCHPDAGPGMGEVRMHVVIDKKLYPYEYYTALGFTILTLGAFIPLIIVLVLELIRDLFPNLSLKKRRRN